MESGEIARFMIRYGQLPATAFARHTSKVANMFVVIGIGVALFCILLTHSRVYLSD